MSTIVSDMIARHGEGNAPALEICERRAGWPWRLPARAPTDPDVLALEHPVPRPTGRPPKMVHEAIRSSSGDMPRNLDVLRMFPSIGSSTDGSLPPQTGDGLMDGGNDDG